MKCVKLIFALYLCTCFFENSISKNILFVLDSTIKCLNRSYEYSNESNSKNFMKNQFFHLSVEDFIKSVSNKTLKNKSIFGLENPLSNYVSNSNSLTFYPIATCEHDKLQHQHYKTKNVSFAFITMYKLKLLCLYQKS